MAVSNLLIVSDLHFGEELLPGASAERRRSLAESIVERKALDLVIGASQVRDEPIPEPAGAA